MKKRKKRMKNIHFQFIHMARRKDSHDKGWLAPEITNCAGTPSWRANATPQQLFSCAKIARAASHQRKMKRWCNSPSHICNHLWTHKMTILIIFSFFLFPIHFPWKTSQRWDILQYYSCSQRPPQYPLQGSVTKGGGEKLLFAQASITSWGIQGAAIPMKFSRALTSNDLWSGHGQIAEPENTAT